jgi:hypothetical protein
VGDQGSQRGITDPDDWLGWWLSLHPSDLFAGAFGRFAMSRMVAPEPGSGRGVIRFEERGEVLEVDVSYVLERFEYGWVFHVTAIKCADDPAPPLID